MTLVQRRKTKRCFSRVFPLILTVFVFYLIILIVALFYTRTCSPENDNNELVDREDEWQYQNSFTEDWYHWRTLYKNENYNDQWNVKWFNVDPTSSLGVIVYLTRRNEIDSLRKSLAQLSKLLVNNPRPVVIFHEGDFSDDTIQQSLAQTAGSHTPLGFERIQFSNSSHRPQSVHRTIPLSYYHMCRFFILMLPNHPLMTLFSFYWRLDAHSFIFGPTPIQDPFEIMEKNQIQYAFIMTNEEAGHYVTGLWPLFQKFLANHCLQPSIGLYKTQTSLFGDYSLAIIFTNFAIAKVSLFRDHSLMQAWLQTVDHDGGIYRYRWGDAPVHTLALTQFLPRNQIVRLRYFGYMHRYEYICAHGIEGQLCQDQVQPLFGESKKKYFIYDDGCYPSTRNPLCHYYPELR